MNNGLHSPLETNNMRIEYSTTHTESTAIIHVALGEVAQDCEIVRLGRIPLHTTMSIIPLQDEDKSAALAMNYPHPQLG